MSSFLVVRAPHYVKEAELGRSFFFRSTAYGKCGGVSNVLKRERALKLPFSFLSSNYGATTVANISQLSN